MLHTRNTALVNSPIQVFIGRASPRILECQQSENVTIQRKIHCNSWLNANGDKTSVKVRSWSINCKEQLYVFASVAFAISTGFFPSLWFCSWVHFCTAFLHSRRLLHLFSSYVLVCIDGVWSQLKCFLPYFHLTSLVIFPPFSLAFRLSNPNAKHPLQFHQLKWIVVACPAV